MASAARSGGPRAVAAERYPHSPEGVGKRRNRGGLMCDQYMTHSTGRSTAQLRRLHYPPKDAIRRCLAFSTPPAVDPLLPPWGRNKGLPPPAGGHSRARRPRSNKCAFGRLWRSRRQPTRQPLHSPPAGITPPLRGSRRAKGEAHRRGGGGTGRPSDARRPRTRYRNPAPMPPRICDRCQQTKGLGRRILSSRAPGSSGRRSRRCSGST